MANPETIIASMRRRMTATFDTLQDAAAVIEDKDDFVAEEGAAFFTDWFSEVVGYDIEFDDMLAAVAAMETLLATFDTIRSKLQVVRLR